MSDQPRLLKKPPKGRSYEQILNQYLVEREIANRLRASTPDERRELYATMYEELFRRVPDHQRILDRDTPERSGKKTKTKLKFLRNFLTAADTFAEFAPGDCRLAFAVTRKASKVYGIDISDQRAAGDENPQNFELILYDGYELKELADGSVDIFFSDQMIEHLHPDETKAHFHLVRQKLRDGGCYVFRIPHAMSGPHDVSRFFSYVAQGFHLKEWTFREIRDLTSECRMDRLTCFWFARGIRIRLPYAYFSTAELFLGELPPKYRRFIAKYCVPSVACAVYKQGE